MKFTRFDISGPILVEPRVFGDERGFFMESYKASAFSKEGIPGQYPQDNHSRSKKGVLRGLHFQIPPYEQGKLVRVIRGRVYDVAVDIRKGSPTFGKWVGVELSGENKHIFWVPPGFAHGFLVLEDDTDFVYKVTTEYAPQHELGILFDDSEIAIPWQDILGSTDFTVSEKDKVLPTLQEYNSPFLFQATNLS
ncbi:MAG: dTDP-4-dehydrorhamnose 3,5-epimerase [Spirochaetota bacterium]